MGLDFFQRFFTVCYPIRIYSPEGQPFCKRGDQFLFIVY